MVTQPPETVLLHDRVDVRPSPIEGKGLFATADLAKGIVVLRLGGRLVSTAELTALVDAAAHDPSGLYIDTVTVYEDAHLVCWKGISRFRSHDPRGPGFDQRGGFFPLTTAAGGRCG